MRYVRERRSGRPRSLGECRPRLSAQSQERKLHGITGRDSGVCLLGRRRPKSRKAESVALFWRRSVLGTLRSGEIPHWRHSSSETVCPGVASFRRRSVLEAPHLRRSSLKAPWRRSFTSRAGMILFQVCSQQHDPHRPNRNRFCFGRVPSRTTITGRGGNEETPMRSADRFPTARPSPVE